MADLPTGTVTFLFTDVEGSIKLWEQDATAMQAALARHDEILKQAIEERGGCVLKTTGDAFCPAFPTAWNALEAILDAQRALSGEGWKETLPFKVRMALHSGEAEDKWGHRRLLFQPGQCPGGTGRAAARRTRVARTIPGRPFQAGGGSVEGGMG